MLIFTGSNIRIIKEIISTQCEASGIGPGSTSNFNSLYVWQILRYKPACTVLSGIAAYRQKHQG